MQEEVESRTVNLAITTTKLTVRTVVSAAQMYLRHRKEVAAKKLDEKPTGKQTVKDLIGQNQGVSSIDISKTDLKGFEGVARKYGVDYAIRKDASVHPPKYLVFFKAKDADALDAICKEYQSKVMGKGKKPSILAQLNKFKELVASLPKKVRQKQQERDL